LRRRELIELGGRAARILRANKQLPAKERAPQPEKEEAALAPSKPSQGEGWASFNAQGFGTM